MPSFWIATCQVPSLPASLTRRLPQAYSAVHAEVAVCVGMSSQVCTTFIVLMEKCTCAGRFAEEGGSPKRRRLEAGPGYASKNAGFPLRQVPLSGPQTDQQGVPLDPQQVCALADCIALRLCAQSSTLSHPDTRSRTSSSSYSSLDTLPALS